MTDIVRLSRADLSTPAYRELIASLFVSGDIDRRLQYAAWAFVENPALRSDEDLPIYVCRIDGRSVGQLAIIPSELVLAGERFRGGWCVDFFVDPSFQRRGIGGKLLRAAFMDFPVLMTLGQTDASFELFSARLRWIFNDNRLTNYKSFLRMRVAVEYALTKLPLFKGSVRMASRQTGLAQGSGSCVDLVDSLEERPDHLRGQDLEAGDFSGVPRTAEFLEWRYLAHPHIKYKINAITVSPGSLIHVVWRVLERDRRRTAVIVDIVYPGTVGEGAMREALGVFRRYARSMNMELIECQTSDALVLGGLGDGPLARRERGHRFLYGMSSMEECPVVDSDRWKLYAGDCDVEALSF